MANTVDITITAKDQASATLKGLGGETSKLGGIFKTAAGTALGFAGALGGIAVLKGGFNAIIGGAIESQKVMAQTEAVIKSTGGAAGFSSKQIADMATDLSKIVPIDDEVIQSAENMLLTFTSIGKDVFPQATKTVLDMSIALGQDTKDSAIQLGKALNDPITGVTALRRVGVQFTDSQQEMIKGLVESGDLMGAQKLILQELQVEFGGSAEAAGKTFGGQLTILKTKLGNVAEDIGANLLPQLLKLMSLLTKTGEALANKLMPVLDTAKGVISAFVSALNGEGVTSDGLAGMAERLAVVFHDKLIPAVKDFSKLILDDGARTRAALIGIGVAVATFVVPPFVAWAVATIAAFAPLAALVAVSAAVGVGLVALEQKTGVFSATLHKVLPALKEFWAVHGPKIIAFAKDAAKWLADLGKAALKMGKDIGEFLAPALDTLSDLWANLRPVLQKVGEIIETQVLPPLKKFGDWLTEHKPVIIAVAAAVLLFTNPWLLVAAALTVVLAKWDEISAMFTKTIPGAIDSLMAKVTGFPVIGEIISGTFEAMWIIAQTIWAQLQNVVETTIKVIGDIIKITMALIHGDWSSAWEGIKQLASDIWEGISAAIGIWLEGLKALILNQLATLAGIFGDAFQAAKDVVGEKLGEIAAQVYNLAGDLYTYAKQAAHSFVKGIIDGIQDMWEEAKKKLADFGSMMNPLDSPPGWHELPMQYRQFGETLMSNLAAGIDAGAPVVADALRQLLAVAGLVPNPGGITAVDVIKGLQPTADRRVKDVLANADAVRRKTAKLARSAGVQPLHPQPDIYPMAHGGIVRRPTLAYIGEAGPEAVIPLSGSGGGMGGTINIIINALDGASVQRVIPQIAAALARYQKGAFA